MKILSFFQKSFAFLARPRVLAIIVLLFLVALPASLYYFFMMRNTSTLTVSLSPIDANEATVSIRSELTQSWLPLLDRVFSYEKKCSDACTFSPIPPAKYSISIEHEGSRDISGSVIVEAGNSATVSYVFEPDIILHPVSWEDNSLTDDEKILRQKDIKEAFGDDVFIIDRDVYGTFFVYKNTANGSEILTWKDEDLEKIYSFPFSIESTLYDTFHETFIILSKKNEQYVASKNFEKVQKIDLSDPIEYAFYSGEEWKIRTKTDVYTQNTKLQKNTRFTDFADLSERYRLGYISADDTKRLSLSNFDLGNMQLLLLDRKNTTTIQIDTDHTIQGIFTKEGVVYAYDDEINIYKILVPFLD